MRTSVLVLAFLLSASALFAQDRAAVERAKAQLTAAGVEMGGPCGAVKIANLVAWNARPAYGLLWKQGGNRAALKADGSCLDGDHTRDAGFATDYLIDRQGFGYDLLSDGGGENGPQWAGPETAFIARNLQNFSEPLDPAAYMRPTPVIVPTVPVPDQSYSIAVLTQLAAIKLALDDQHAVLAEHVRQDDDAHKSINQNVTDGRAETRSIGATLKSALGFAGKYVLPAIGGWIAAKKAS